MCVWQIYQAEDRQVLLDPAYNSEVSVKIEQHTIALTNKKQSKDYYKDNRRANVSKIVNDIAIGKKGEIVACYHLVNDRKFPALDIDFEIREGASKGWNVDLPFSGKDKEYPDVHVKSCGPQTLNITGGECSWTFQLSNANGKGGRDPVFDGPDTDLVAFVYIDDLKAQKGVIKAIMPWGDVKKHLRDPISISLRGLKKCIYMNDLIRDTREF